MLGAPSRAAPSTGAPKIAAVDLIAALEPVGRGASMGALGRVRGNGDLELALTIRTFAVADGLIHLWVGGGIVWTPIHTTRSPSRRQGGATPGRDRRAARAVSRGHGSPAAMSELPLAAAVSGLGVVDPARAVIAATDEGFTRGRAAFETLRVYSGRPFRLEEHLARLAGSGRPARGCPARPRGPARARRRRAPGCRDRRCRPAHLLDTRRSRRGTDRDRARVADPRLDRGREGAWPAARLARVPRALRAVAPPRDEVGELCDARRGGGRGAASRRRRRRPGRRRRNGPRGDGDEHLVARG